MPILKGAATFTRYRVETDGRTPSDWKKNLAKSLRHRAFVPLKLDGPDERAQGFVELADTDAAEFSAGSLYDGEWAIFSYRIDEVRLPVSAVKSELEKWQKQFERENERKPGKREKGDAKEEIRRTLRIRFPLATKTFDVSWNIEGGTLLVWASSRKAIDEVQEAVEQAFKLRLIPQVPVTIAAKLGIAEKALAPTPALSMPDRPKEARDGDR